jgi:hypothetical protein
MPRLLVHSKWLSKSKLLPLKLSSLDVDSEFMEVELCSQYLKINSVLIPIVRSGNDKREYTLSISTNSIKKLMQVCQIIGDQPIVLILSEDRSIITLDNIDL